MIGLKAGVKFLKLLNAIPYANEHPIGCFLVAPPGSGKSFLLTKFVSKDFFIVSDLTGFGLEKLLLTLDIKKRGYVVVPDILRSMSRKSSFEQLTALLNILLEEGLRVIKRHNLDMELSSPLRYGFISAITDNEFMKVASKFWSTGLLSRILIFSFGYQNSDIAKIQRVVGLGEDEKIDVKGNGLNVVKEVKIPERLLPIMDSLSRKLGKNKYPFRNLKIIRKLAKANALREGRDVVGMRDIKEVFYLAPFIFHADEYTTRPFNNFDEATDLHYFILRMIGQKRITSIDKVKVIGYTAEEVNQALNSLIARGFVKIDQDGLKLNL